MQAPLKKAPPIFGLLISYVFCLILVRYLFITFPMPSSTDKHAPRLIPLGHEHISNRFYAIENLDFKKLESASIKLRSNKEAYAKTAFFLIPDYDPSDFFCARASSIKGLPSGYLRYIDGKPVNFSPVRADIARELKQHSPNDENDNRTTSLRFFSGNEAGRLPRPAEKLFLFSYPLSSSLDKSISGLTLEFEDGKEVEIEISPTFFKTSYFIVALFVALLAVRLDAFVLRAIASEKLRALTPFKIRAYRLSATLLLTLMTSGKLHDFSTRGSPIFFLFTLITILIALWGLAGAYPLTRKKRTLERISKPAFIAGTFATIFAIVAAPILIPGFVFVAKQRWLKNNFIEKNQFDGNIVRRTDENRKIVLCMGGSSTIGDPFDDGWPYNYPRLMNDIFKNKRPEISVANCGIPGTDTEYAWKNFPALIKSVKPDLVFLNYTHNDNRAYHIQTFLAKIRRLLPVYGKEEPYLTRYKKALGGLIGMVREHGGDCVIVMEPDFSNVYYDVEHFRIIRAAALETANELNVRIFDPGPAFAANKQRFLFVDDHIHITRFGTALMAELLSKETENYFYGSDKVEQ